MSMSFYIATVYLEYYENLPSACNIQKNFSAVKVENFIGKKSIFLTFLHNALIVVALKKRLGKAVIKSTHNPCLGSEIKKMYTLLYPSFTT